VEGYQKTKTAKKNFTALGHYKELGQEAMLKKHVLSLNA
jgi:hypothetical protein